MPQGGASAPHPLPQNGGGAQWGPGKNCHLGPRRPVAAH